MHEAVLDVKIEIPSRLGKSLLSKPPIPRCLCSRDPWVLFAVQLQVAWTLLQPECFQGERNPCYGSFSCLWQPFCLPCCSRCLPLEQVTAVIYFFPIFEAVFFFQNKSYSLKKKKSGIISFTVSPKTTSVVILCVSIAYFCLCAGTTLQTSFWIYPVYNVEHFLHIAENSS